MTTDGKIQTKTMSVYRVLLRVRMLYYLKAEVLGEAANQALEGVSSRYRVCQPMFSTLKKIIKIVKQLCKLSVVHQKSLSNQ